MRRPVRIRSVRPPKAERQAPPSSRRDRLAVLLALVTVVCLGSAFFLSKGTQFLMPGPLASAHGAIENCSACHTKSGSGKLSWLHGLVAGDPLADSKACLTCHKMPDTAFNAHSASAEVLKQSTERLTKIAAETPAPQSARAQSIAFPTDDVVARGLYCATCHQEHQGVNFNLNKISNEQCRSCHVVKFDSFDGHHPKFENYPFKQRTRIIYDHAGHFGKHFPEVAKKDPAKRIPDTCSTCHNSREDKRVMAVAPFEQTCTACHLDQIIGKERASGPKGIAFLTLPGLDLQTLKKKKAAIGEWPDASEAELTPFMKVMISRNERGRALIKTVDSLNLQDLSRCKRRPDQGGDEPGLGDQGAVLCADHGKSVGRAGRPQYWRRGEAECRSRCRSDREHPARCGHQCAAAVAAQSRHGNGQSPRDDSCGQRQLDRDDYGIEIGRRRRDRRHRQTGPTVSVKSAASRPGVRHGSRSQGCSGSA